MATTFTKSKRGFTSVRTVRARRPIDKSLVNVVLASLAATQANTELIAATFPCTITGMRWDLTAIQSGGTGSSNGKWAIVVNRDGLALSTMSLTTGGTLYEPEEDVLAFGSWIMDNNPPEGRSWVGSTKTMRKLKLGDRLQFIAKGVATELTDILGTIQFFCKS